MNKVWKFHNDVDTDQIIASQYLLLPDIEAMKQYTFESLDPDFAKKAQPGDLIVAGENFGCGSSREQAPSVLKALGIKAVIAKSFARIVIRLTSDFLLLYAKIYMNMWKMVDRQILIYLLVQLPLMGRYFPVQNFRNICRIF